jgi:transposase
MGVAFEGQYRNKSVSLFQPLEAQNHNNVMDENVKYYVGIDWADQKHDITILEPGGAVMVDNWTIKKNRTGFEKLLDKLRSLSDDPHHFKIGIETAFNLLVDFLIAFEYSVFAISPASMKSFRKRYRASGARDDPFDAFVLADVLRTDKACWRKVDFGSEQAREIRLLAHDHHDLVDQLVALHNSLLATLKMYYPEYIHFFNDVSCANSLAFLQAYPDFDAASQLTHQQLADFFKEHLLRNGKIVNKIYELLHQKPLMVPPSLIRAKKLKAVAFVPKIIAVQAEIEQYANRLKELVEQHPDGKIFLSYPGVSYITAARLIALFGDNRKLFATAGELQALAGTSPVTQSSGKNFRVVYFRFVCNKFYRDVIHCLAFSSLRSAKWALAYYHQHRALGKKHHHALRCLANMHLRILFAMWKNGAVFDENLFLAQRARHLIANQKF